MQIRRYPGVGMFRCSPAPFTNLFKVSSNSIHTFLTYDNYTKRIKTKGQQIIFLYLSTVVPT